MGNDCNEILKRIKNKLDKVEIKLHVVLGWILVFLTSVVMLGFLCKCYEAVLGKATLNWQDGSGFLVSLVLLVIGIVSIKYWKKEKPL
jgi:hypothetical protein